MRRAILGKPDDFGTRWSYDRTIYVRHARDGYLIHDEITRTSWTRQSLDAARQVVEHVIDSRPQIEWAGGWTGGDAAAAQGLWPERVSADGRVRVSVDRDPDREWWAICIEVNTKPWPRCFSWRVEGHIKGAAVRAQAAAWGAHKATQEDSP